MNLLRIARALGLLLCLVAPTFASGGVTWVRVEGALDIGTLSLVRRALDHADENDQDLVIELDTPGGEVELMWRLAGLLEGGPARGVGTTVWVNDRAFSAGAVVAFVCEQIYMAPGSVIGAATVIVPGPAGNLPEVEAVRAKMNSGMRASFRGKAEEHGRSPALAEAMVDMDVEVRLVRIGTEERLLTGTEYDDAIERGEPVELLRTVCPRGELLTLTAFEARDLGLADGLADDAAAVLGKLGLPDVPVDAIERSASEDLAASLAGISWILLIAGLSLAFMEVKAPGFGVPGILSMICFGTFLFGQYLVGLAEVPHMVAVGLGLVLVAVELFLLPGFLWTGLIGALLIGGGLLGSMVGDSIWLQHPLDREIVLQTSFEFALFTILTMAAIWAVLRNLPSTPVLGKLVLAPESVGDGFGSGIPEDARRAVRARVGARGRALTDLRPVGKVAIEDDPESEFEARASTGALSAGCLVRVIEVSAGRLVVEAWDIEDGEPK